MQPRLEPSPSRMDGYKGKLWKLPVTFSFAKNQFFPSTNNPESCHRWENIVVLEIRKRNSTFWEWSWWVSPVRFSISEQKLFFENYRKVITFQSPSPDILLRLNIDNSRKVVSSRFPEKSRFPISWKKSPVYYQSFCPTGWLSGTRWGFCRNRI